VKDIGLWARACRRRSRHGAIEYAAVDAEALWKRPARGRGFDAGRFVQQSFVNRHTGPASPSDTPPVPEPSYAERARHPRDLGRAGTLATLSRRHVGHPFASIMPYAWTSAATRSS